MKLYLRNILLWLTLISGVLVVALKIYGDLSFDKNSIPVLGKINQNIKQEIGICEKEVDKLLQYLDSDKKLHFSTIGFNYKHPILVFKDSRLLLWTSPNVPYGAENILLQKKYHFYNEREEKFICIVKHKKINNKVYQIVGLVPLVKKYSIQNNFLGPEYNSKIFEFNSFSCVFFEYHSELENNNFYAPDNSFLFSLNIANQTSENQNGREWLFLCLISSFIVFLVTYLSLLIHKKITLRFSIKQRVLFWVFWVFSIRVFLMLFKYPAGFKNFKTFQQKYFIANYWCPSMGDFLLHWIAIVVILGIIYFYFKNEFFEKKIVITGYKKLISIFLIIISVHFLYRTVYESVALLNMNYEHGNDITKDINLDSFKLVFALCYIFICSSFFALYQVLVHLFNKVCENDHKILKLKIFLFATVVYALVLFLAGYLNIWLLIIGILHFVVILFFEIPNQLKKLDYTFYIYLLVNSSVCGMAGSLAIYKTENHKDLQNKDSFSTTLMTENDLYGEFLLKEASTRIENDQSISNRLESIPLSSFGYTQQKIARVHLNKYFNKYDVEIKVFDASGNDLGQPFAPNYHDLKKKYMTASSRTEYDNIYFVHKRGEVKRYVSMIDLYSKSRLVGYVVLEFRFKKYTPNSIYPALLIDKRFARGNLMPEYSYALYSHDTLSSNAGEYIYNNRLFEKAVDAKYKGENVLLYQGFCHYLSFNNQNTIIVSSKDHTVEVLVSNFSFLFIIQLFTIFGIVSYYFLYLNYSRQSLNYSTKIQIYLNIAFVLPLIVLTLVFLLITIRNYNEDLKSNFNNIAVKAAGRLTDFIDEYRSGKVDFQKFNNSFLELAQNLETDINLYDRKGKVLNTTQPLIFERKLLSNKINPIAYAEIIEKKKNSFIVNEKIGNLSYYNVYTSLKSQKTGLIQGIVSVPFYETRAEIQKKLISVIVTIFNIFVVVFLLFVVVTFYATKSLTLPISQLRMHMKDISLQKENEKIEWHSKDEIGLLIKEYNRMILKLQESKELLSRTEKESAWREMAKQVAHEIKNPLTPMKLNLQYLEMMIKNGESKEKIEMATNRAIKILLEQINTLSEIATSFSNFAKMPLPKLEPYNLLAVAKSVVELHKANPEIEISCHFEDGECQTLGDGELMGRILNNLIINGIQSVTPPVRPEISLVMKLRERHILIEITDNGSGIPSDIKDKVFLPNFSTKYFGSGLGLAMAKQGIEFWGGTIYFVDAIPFGTTFVIELPIKNFKQTTP